MSNQEEKNELEVKYDIDGTEIRLTKSMIEKYIVGGETKITMPEFKFFTELCKARKLNPFLKEVYCIKYSAKSPAQIVVGKDVVLKRAILHPQYDGKETGVIVKQEDGTILERQGCFVEETEKLVGGWAKVYRKDRKYPEYMSVSFKEVAQTKGDGGLNKNWKSKGATMVEKVAKVRALREAFVDELQGMYEAEEMGVNLEPSNEPEVVEEPNVSEQMSGQEIIDIEPKEVDMSEL